MVVNRLPKDVVRNRTDPEEAAELPAMDSAATLATSTPACDDEPQAAQVDVEGAGCEGRVVVTC